MPGAPSTASRTSWRPTLIDAYLLRLLVGPALAVLGLTLVAFLLELTLRLIDQFEAIGARLSFLFALVASQVPYQLGLALPAAFFAAIFIVIARLDQDSEIDAILAAGVSFERLVAPLVFAGVVLGVVNFLIMGYLQPYSQFADRAVRNAAMNAGWTAKLDPQVFINAGPDFTITADEADATGRGLRGVFIRRKSDGGETLVTATSGSLRPAADGKTTQLELDGGVLFADGPKGAPRLLRFGALTDREALGGARALSPRGAGDEKELTVPELLDELARPDAVIPKRSLEAELLVRLVRSLALPFLPLLGLPLALAAKRGSRAPGMIFGALVLVGFHHGVTLAKDVADTGLAPPIVAIGGIFLAMVASALWVFLSSRTRPGETPVLRFFSAIERVFARSFRVRPRAELKKGELGFGGYLSRIFAVRTAVALLALLAVLQLIDLLERTSDILARGGPLDIGRYLLLRLPSMFQQSAGFAVLAGALFTFTQLAATSELVVMRAAGLSLYQIFRRALPVALVVAALQLVVAEELAPRAEQALSTWWTATAPAAQRTAPAPHWFRIGGDVVSLGDASADGEALKNISIYDRDANKALIRRIRAASASPEPGGWRLRDVTVTDLGREQATTAHAPSLHWATDLTAGEAARLFSNAYRISSRTALRALRHEGPVTQAPSRFETQLYRTLAQCVAPIIMLLLALPSALGHARTNRAGLMVYGLGMGLFYLVADGLLTAMGQTGVLPPGLAAWGAPVIFAAGAVSFLLYADE